MRPAAGPEHPAPPVVEDYAAKGREVLARHPGDPLSPEAVADHFATLCDALKLKIPGQRDGVSLLPVLTSKGKPEHNPMVWAFPEYGGQVAVRIGDFKVVRQGLKTKTPGSWEVYDLAKDRSEAHDLATSRADLIQQAEVILRREVADNVIFPLAIPGVNVLPAARR